MTESLQQDTKTRWRLIAFLFVITGIFIRLMQFDEQLLLDDEWHSVHQLMDGKSPAELFRTFGRADYSIPMGLIYWLMANFIGLSEQLMKLPLLIAGIVTLILFTLWADHQINPRIAAVFAGLLSVSPMLVIYSTTARPYAATLLISYCAIHYFERWWADRRRSVHLAAAYVFLSALAVWLHPISGPFLVAPLLYHLIGSSSKRDWVEVGHLILVCLLFAGSVAVLLAPPLLSDFESLAVKVGAAELNPSTFVGVWHFWLGTTHLIPTLCLLALAMVGFPSLLRESSLARVASIGILLTVLGLLATQPAWSQWPVTSGRYLLPALPLLLLAVATGVDRLYGGFRKAGRVMAKLYYWIIAGLFIFLLPQILLLDLTRIPNSQITHSLFQFELMHEENPIIRYQKDHLIESTFWEEIANSRRDDRAIAVAPFYFETYNWGAVTWERRSGRRVKPLMLNSFCADRARGEVPRDERFQFNNVVYARELQTRTHADYAWVVLTKPFVGFERGNPNALVGGGYYSICLEALTRLLGEPVFEDEALVAFKLASEKPRSGTSNS